MINLNENNTSRLQRLREDDHYAGQARLAVKGAALRACPTSTKTPSDFNEEDEADLVVAGMQLERENVELEKLERTEEIHENISSENKDVYVPKTLWERFVIFLYCVGICASMVSLFGQPFSWAERNFNVSESPLPSIALAIPILLMGFVVKIYVSLLRARNAGPHVIITTLSLLCGIAYVGLFDCHFVFREIVQIDGFEEVVRVVKLHGLFIASVFAEMGFCFAFATALGLAIRPKKSNKARESETTLQILAERKAPIYERIDALVRKITILEERKAAYRAYVKASAEN